MKILIVGECSHSIYEKAIAKGFANLNHNIKYFCWKSYFNNSFFSKFRNKFLIGDTIDAINRDLIDVVKSMKPDLVFIYRGTHIKYKTLIEIKKFNSKIFGYNNDDPFSNRYRLIDFRLWSLYRKSIPYYDWIFSYRLKNIEDYKKIGFNNTSLLRSYYIKENNFYIENSQKKYDVIFIGHFENDGRDEILKYLIENDIKVQIFGTRWEESKLFSYFQNNMYPIKPLYGDLYNLTINQSKIALVFLSKINHDTYTRRCFEIPITKTMMISEYTKDLNENLFKEGREAEYFRDKKELLEKVKFYLNNEEELKRVGDNGYKRVITDGHEVIDRCKEIVRVFNNGVFK